MELGSRTVADFFAQYKQILSALGVVASIDPLPVELKKPIRFSEDIVHRTYNSASAHRFWKILCNADRLLKEFSTNFQGKISPVHFFWGSFDLACTRFNGRSAPARPGADAIQSEAYSHECISAGFWPGNGGYGQAAFYAYAAPVPNGLAGSVVRGPGSFNKDLGEFILNYTDVRAAADPDRTIIEFFADTYSAAADAAGWDRASLDRPIGA